MAIAIMTVSSVLLVGALLGWLWRRSQEQKRPPDPIGQQPSWYRLNATRPRVSLSSLPSQPSGPAAPFSEW